MDLTETAATLTLIATIAKEHGCRLIDVDLEKNVIDLEGSDDDKFACALALEEALN